ncbi:MAG: VOC family protein [Bacteroidota bacterium]
MQILQLELLTRQLSAQRAFYVDLLGFELKEATENSFSIQAGRSVLCFRQSEDAVCYHFAFNIPALQMEEACHWTRARCPLLQDGDAQIIDFPNWNAQAIYFFDADLNIVEFIARKNLALPSVGAFSAKSVDGISEIGFPVDQVGGMFGQLEQALGVKQYSGDLDRFCAVGDEEGLFIVVDRHSKKWYPTSVQSAPHPIVLTVELGSKKYALQFDVEAQLAIQQLEME